MCVSACSFILMCNDWFYELELWPPTSCILLWISGCWATWILMWETFWWLLQWISVIFVCLLIISLFSNYISILLHLFSTGYSLGSINQSRTFLVQWLAQVLNKPIRISLSGRWILNAMIQRKKMVGDHSAWWEPAEEGPC